MTNLPRATLRTGSHPRTILNRNLLVRAVPEVNGVKTGHTLDARATSSWARPARTASPSSRSSSTSPARRRATQDSLALIRYGLSRYHRATPVRKGEAFASVKLAHRDERAQLVAARTVVRTARRGERLPVRVLDVPGELDGPLPAGSRVGTIEVRWRGRTIASVPLVTRRAIAQASVLQRGDDLLGPHAGGRDPERARTR